MSFYIITKPNPNRFPLHTWFESFDLGCQQVDLDSETGRAQVRREKGLIYPDNQIKPFSIRVLTKGLDK